MANQNVLSMDLDFTGIESYANIPEGVHTVKVKDAEFTKAQTGSNQLSLLFENNDGATKRAWFSLLPQALWKLKQVLEALSIPCDGKIKLTAKQLIGKTCVITVEKDANDPSREIVTKVAKLGTAVAQPTVAPAPEAFMQPTPVAPVPPTFPQETIPSTPMMTPPSHSEPVQAPAPQPTPTAPQGNLPPWMQNSQNNTPQGNLPPWMKQ